MKSVRTIVARTGLLPAAYYTWTRNVPGTKAPASVTDTARTAALPVQARQNTVKRRLPPQ